MDTPANTNPYLALGVRPFINCCSVRTVHGGSLMLPQVRAAMAEASRHFVNLDELMEAAGRRLAELTGSEAALVTCGSAAAVALGTAACVAGNDPIRMLRLPFTEGWPNKVVMVRTQRFAYDQAIRMIGTTIVEIDTLAELDAALDDKVAMIAVLGTHEHVGPVRIEDLAARAKPRGIPILVDAASEHLQRPSPWFARGADLVVYSGGKFLRGPQTSGLLLGRADLVQAAWRNASPHQALGRPMKVSKEDVVGLVAAVEFWMESRDLAAERARWQGDLDIIAATLAPLGDIECTVQAPQGVVRVPSLRVQWGAARGVSGEAMRRRLGDGEPRVILDDTSLRENSITIDPFGLQPGQARQVAEAIAASLALGPASAPAPAAPSADLSGSWVVTTEFLHGTRNHRMRLQQEGNSLTGHQTSPQFEGKAHGTIADSAVRLNFETWFEGSIIRYALEGSASGAEMHGIALLGTSTPHHTGPVNFAQFGEARWSAVRA